jgi:hypothetical protein
MDSQMIQEATEQLSSIKRPLRTLTLEELGALEDGEQFDKEMRRSTRQAWKSSANFINLASQLGIGGVFTATSDRHTQGEYVDGTIPYDWSMSAWLRARLNAITEMRSLPVILIDIEQAFPQEGIPKVIAHEIGHHLDHLANGYPKARKPKESFMPAFKRAGFNEYSNDRFDLFSELIGETLGQYIQGHKLNAILRAEVDKVLSKLSTKHRNIIQRFRNKQLRKN